MSSLRSRTNSNPRKYVSEGTTVNKLTNGKLTKKGKEDSNLWTNDSDSSDILLVNVQLR